ncbi:hypothetical protein BC937DRAFT_89750, partial [Endogone sp. FLAS-F59071]
MLHRMQIHFNSAFSSDRQITVFSKSKRNSTIDRQGTWRIIASALGHDPSFLHTVFSSSSSISSSLSLEERQAPTPQTKVQNCIVEAELLVYNEAQSRIEEFGSVRELQDAEHSSDKRV